MNTECPHCGKDNHDIAWVDNPIPPRPGDVSICSSCLQVATITEDGLRKPTTEEMTRYMENEVVVATILALEDADTAEEGISMARLEVEISRVLGDTGEERKPT